MKFELFKGRGRSPSCSGRMTYREDSIIIDCSGCNGNCDLSDPVCFRGIASRIAPGFSGEVILSGTDQKGYSGPVVEALESFSEIEDLLNGLVESSKGSSSGKIARDLRERFIRDPFVPVERSSKVRKAFQGSAGGKDMIPVLDRIMERCDLMKRKLERAV